MNRNSCCRQSDTQPRYRATGCIIRIKAHRTRRRHSAHLQRTEELLGLSDRSPFCAGRFIGEVLLPGGAARESGEHDRTESERETTADAIGYGVLACCAGSADRGCGHCAWVSNVSRHISLMDRRAGETSGRDDVRAAALFLGLVAGLPPGIREHRRQGQLRRRACGCGGGEVAGHRRALIPGV